MKKIFEFEGYLIKDESKKYYAVQQIEGDGGIVPVKNNVFRETREFWEMKELIKGKKVKVVIYELE